MGVARGGVTTPIRTKHGDGADGTPNNNSKMCHISKIHHITRISGEISNGAELINKWVEVIVLVVRPGQADGHKILKINNSSQNSHNNSNNMEAIVTIRVEAITISHSHSPLTNMVLITRGSPTVARQGSYVSHQWIGHHEVLGLLLYKSCCPLELTKLVMRGALLLGESTLHQAAVEERESQRANE